MLLWRAREVDLEDDLKNSDDLFKKKKVEIVG